METHWDAIVIGSGLGGLSAAAKLARSGLRVLVLEQHVYAGGYAHSFPRKVPGTRIVYDFDVALHQTGDLAEGRVMKAWLEEVGVLPRVSLRRFDQAYRTIGPAHDLMIPADIDAYERLLVREFPDQAPGIRDLFATMRRIDVGKAGGSANETAIAAMELTLQELVEQHVRDERILCIFASLWSYLGNVPQHCSAFAYAVVWCSLHIGGCFFVRGGGQALSKAFVSSIEENGGRVLVRTEVEQILTELGHVTGVATKERGTFRAPIVISNASALTTFHQLLDDQSLCETDAKVADALPLSASIHQAYVGIRGNAAELGLPERSRFVVRRYDFEEEWAALERGDYRSQGWLIGNHSVADPGQAPEGRSILLAATMAKGSEWVALAPQEYAERKNELQEYFVDRIAEAIPDVRDRIEIIETGTPHTMERYSLNPHGAIYGYGFTKESHSILRPQPRTSVPGLFLAGAWTYPAAGFEGAMLSGRNTSQLVLEDIGRASRPSTQ